MMKSLFTVIVAAVMTAAVAAPALADTPLPSGGGGKNIVVAMNRSNGRLTVRANLQVNREPGPTVQPANVAVAMSSCTDCQTLVVALQLNIASTRAAIVAPQNAAAATNVDCTRCHTVARAVQYLFTVPDPLAGTPPQADEVIRALDRALTNIENDQTLTAADAEAKLDAVIVNFQSVAPTFANERQAAP